MGFESLLNQHAVCDHTGHTRRLRTVSFTLMQGSELKRFFYTIFAVK